jgi:hypothetical protein
MRRKQISWSPARGRLALGAVKMGVVEMSIKETKEQIAAYPTYDGWASLHSGDDSSPTILHISRLKALADSHTALLEAAKVCYRLLGRPLTGVWDDLEAAIKQAEGGILDERGSVDPKFLIFHEGET